MALLLQINFTENYGHNLEVWFTSDSGQSYARVAELGPVSSYDWTIPSLDLAYGGALKIKSFDYAGNVNEKTSDHVFAVAGDSLLTTVDVGWNLWGTPLTPYNDTMEVNLEDDFLGYWVTYDFVNNGYTFNGVLKEAEGYWLGALNAATVDVLGTPLTSAKTMALSQGWELVSNPLVLDVIVDSLLLTKNDTTKTYTDAVNAGWVNSIYGYDGAGYISASVLEPWNGYWIGVLDADVEMTFPIHRDPAGGSPLQKALDTGWMIAFNTRTDHALDITTTIGVMGTGSEGFDAHLDQLKAPNPPGPEYVSLYLPHPEWQILLGDRFAVDIRGEIPAETYQEWIMEVDATEDNVVLRWTPADVPDQYELGIDVGITGSFADMSQMDSVVVTKEATIAVRVGSNVLDIDDVSAIPEVFALHQNYPNPFNPTSTIRYDIPEGTYVQMIVFDIVGREILRLIDSRVEPGYHQIIWNGRDRIGREVPTGVYITRILTPQYTKSIKMVLLK